VIEERVAELFQEFLDIPLRETVKTVAIDWHSPTPRSRPYQRTNL
jgi:hypothetical protein